MMAYLEVEDDDDDDDDDKQNEKFLRRRAQVYDHRKFYT
jgi:hypothetical protein